MPVPVLILHTEQALGQWIANMLENLAYARGKHFEVFSSAEALEKSGLLIVDEPQLLIANTASGDVERARSFVRKMKKLNPSIVAASFSVNDLTGEPFDLRIERGDGAAFAAHLIETVRSYIKEAVDSTE